jgi:phage shock protein PspC (stress-responsive transcriptional regulator)
MDKIIQINMAGQAISIDESAYQILREYLDSLERHFRSSNSAGEIMEDIESRIAEMFLQKLKSGRSFIDLSDVNETIEIMGNPSDMGFSEEDSGSSDSSPSNKKLFRDAEDKILGGVCSGLAAYFNVDVSLIRLLFIIAVLFFGVSILPYIILWLVVPEAKSTQDRYRMRGSTPDIHDIARNIRKEAENVAENIKKNSKLQEGLSGIAQVFEQVFKGLGKIAGSFILMALIILSVTIITFFLFTMHGETFHFGSSLLTIPQLFETSTVSMIFIISLLFVFLIPIASLTYFLICFIFDISNARYSSKAWFAIWLICLASMVGSAIYGSNDILFDQFENFRIERTDINTI